MNDAIISTTVGSVTLRKKGAHWFARKQIGKRRFEISLKTGDLDQAILVARDVVPAKVRGAQECFFDRESAPKKADYSRLFARARQRAKSDGVAYTITPEEEAAIIGRSNGACEVTGIPFSLERSAGSYRAPYRMSLDRITSADPYSAGNVRLVCVVVNWALSDWGISAFDRMCSAYAAKKLTGSGAGMGTKNLEIAA